MGERPIYPYIYNVSGVPLFDFMAKKGGVFSVCGGSGRELNCTFDERSISIEDASDPRFHLSAVVDVLGSLHLDLYPRRFPQGERHPDLYAAKFIENALRYFKRKGVVIHDFIASWERGGTNFEEFMGAHERQQGDEKGAAAQTWSARTMAKHGFTNIENIIVGEDKVVVSFSEASSVK